MGRRLAVALAASCLAVVGTGAAGAVAIRGAPGIGDAGITEIQDRWSPADRWGGAGLGRYNSPGLYPRNESPAFGSRYVGPPYYSLQPYRPRVVAPTRVRPPVSEGLPRPWTTKWYAYCSERYASFDRRTGLFVTHAGKQRLCR